MTLFSAVSSRRRHAIVIHSSVVVIAPVSRKFVLHETSVLEFRLEGRGLVCILC